MFDFTCFLTFNNASTLTLRVTKLSAFRVTIVELAGLGLAHSDKARVDSGLLLGLTLIA